MHEDHGKSLSKGFLPTQIKLAIGGSWSIIDVAIEEINERSLSETSKRDDLGFV